MTDDEGQFDYSEVSDEDKAELERLADVVRNGEKHLTLTVVVMGEALLDAKQRFRHGAFSKWCRLELGLQSRRAELYMNVATLFHRYGEDICRLPLTAAEDLGAPSVSEETVEAVLARVRRGERVTVKWVQEMIRRAKESSTGGVETDFELSIKVIRMITDAIGVEGCMLLQTYLKQKPRAGHFVADLAESAALKIRRSRAPKAAPVMLSLTAG